MGFIRDYFVKANDFLRHYLSPVIDKIIQFLQTEEYAVIGTISLFVGLLILIGLFRWLRKTPKLFLFIVFIFAIVITLGLVTK